MTIKEDKVLCKIKELAQEILAMSQEGATNDLSIMAKSMSIITLCDIFEVEQNTPPAFMSSATQPHRHIQSCYNHSNDGVPNFETAQKEQQA